MPSSQRVQNNLLLQFDLLDALRIAANPLRHTNVVVPSFAALEAGTIIGSGARVVIPWALGS